MVNWNHPRVIMARLVLYVLLPLVLLILPASYFDDGGSICLSVLLFNKECYACGMTRSIMHLIHLDFTEAVYFNPIGFLVFPLLTYIWIKYFLKNWHRYNKARLNSAVL